MPGTLSPAWRSARSLTVREHRASPVAAVIVLFVGSAACSARFGGGVGAGRRTSVSPVVATIPLNSYGIDVGVRPDGARAYVSLQTGGILALDLTTGQVAATIQTSGRPYAIAFARDGTHAYVTDLTLASLFALDTTQDASPASIALGPTAPPIRAPAVAVSGDGRWAYVTNATATDDSLLVIDTAKSAVASKHSLDVHPVGVAASPDGQRLYVAGCKLSCINGTLLILDASSGGIVSRIPLPVAPVGLVLASDGGRAYAPTGISGTVQAIDLAVGAVTTIPVDAEALGVDVDPSGAFVYVTCYGAASVSVIGTRISTVIATIRVANEPRAIAVSPDGRFAYVTHASPMLSVIDLQRVMGGVSGP
jgi:YVTN family beta-propeller protein